MQAYAGSLRKSQHQQQTKPPQHAERQRPQEEEQQDPKPRHVQTSRREPQADGTRQLVGYFPR